MGKRIVCFGEVLLRLTAPGRELLLQTPSLSVSVAGAEANVAVALSYFGHEAVMASVLPDNALGRAALGEFRRHGVDTRFVATGDGRMGLFFLTQGAVRRASEVLYDRRESAFALGGGKADVVAALDGAAWFHLSGVTPALNRDTAAAAIAAAKAAAARGVPMSFDGNYRAQLWASWAPEAPAILRQLVEQTTILFGDDRDIALVLERSFDGEPQVRRARAAEAALAAFPRLQRIASTTRSPRAVDAQDYGAVMFTRSGEHRVAEVALDGIVDRVGTGDAFAAGVIHGLITGGDDAAALALGHAAACLKHSVPGDFLPFSADEVRAAASGGLDVKR